MNEKTNEKAEKVQFEGIIEDDKVIISDKECIEEFYNNSYIGTLVKKDDAEDILVLEPIEVLLLYERNRILLYLENNKKNALYDFECLLEYFSQFDDRLWQNILYIWIYEKGGILFERDMEKALTFECISEGLTSKKIPPSS